MREYFFVILIDNDLLKTTNTCSVNFPILLVYFIRCGMMTEQPHYRDSVKKLNSKISEISESELKGKDTIKRDILCDILHISISDKTTTEYQIHEALAPICLKNKLTFGDVKHKMLCNYFGIPVYYKPKKKSYLDRLSQNSNQFYNCDKNLYYKASFH
jgi:hypothetical protein